MIGYEPVNASRCTIIPRADHPISRRNLSENAVRVLYRLRDNGFLAFLVGGCIRDLLLGREPKDFDVVTNATPSQVKKLFRNCRLVGRRFRLAHLHFRDEILEVATFRSAMTVEDEPEESPEGAGRPPRIVKDDGGMILRDNLFGTPEEDARRRDFTVNALCYNIADFSLIDYVGGLDDLERGVIRTIGDPAVRFTEDPVRMLRAIRFAAQLGFVIEPENWRSLVDLSHHITNASPPRLYEEMLKLFLSGEGERCYQLLRQSGVFAALFPAVNSWLETETDGFPHIRFGRALEVIDARTASRGTGLPFPPSSAPVRGVSGGAGSDTPERWGFPPGGARRHRGGVREGSCPDSADTPQGCTGDTGYPHLPSSVQEHPRPPPSLLHRPARFRGGALLPRPDGGNDGGERTPWLVDAVSRRQPAAADRQPGKALRYRQPPP